MIRSLAKKIISQILRLEAMAILKKYRPKIVAVTGSIGKTTAKDAIGTALAPLVSVRASEKSYNSEIGVPLTIIGRSSSWFSPAGWLMTILEGFALLIFRNNYPEWLVLEVGADRPGDISHGLKWLRYDVVVLTSFPEIPPHIEFYQSRDDLVAEESYLLKQLKPDGVVVANTDDQTINTILKNFEGHKVITFGLKPKALVRATYPKIVYDKSDGRTVPVGMSCKIEYGGVSAPLRLAGTVGMHRLFSPLAGLAVVAALDKNLVTSAQAFEAEKPTPGRMRLLPGIKESILIDDSYNSSPTALEAALETLAEVDTTGRKVVIVADMLEIGQHTIPAHEALGRRIATVAETLITVGIRAKFFANGARGAGMKDEQIHSFSDVESARAGVDALIQPKDLILIKGSQSMRLEKVVEELMADPAEAPRLLVRQDTAWRRI